MAYNQYGNDLEMISAILCAGLYPNVVQCKRRGKRTAFYTKEVGKVDIHPASVNAGVHLFPLPFMVYSEKVKTASIFIRDSTLISDYALLMFGGNLISSKTGDGIEMLEGYLHFSASRSVLELIKKLRGELDKLLNRKIKDPGLDISIEGKGVVAAVVELLQSKNVSEVCEIVDETSEFPCSLSETMISFVGYHSVAVVPVLVSFHLPACGSTSIPSLLSANQISHCTYRVRMNVVPRYLRCNFWNGILKKSARNLSWVGGALGLTRRGFLKDSHSQEGCLQESSILAASSLLGYIGFNKAKINEEQISAKDRE
ncbi:hypothetical protein RJ640_003622 [Escallonia rubra]|uniref:Uncharacterized protein n=1 Tax=Escallonia rubra TaxID=112253 RepID=A0AA88R1D4_9ASTE|nr:hypothetical protein RJ640_003622 [Escallonia rubra]